MTVAVREPKGHFAGAHPKHARGAVRLPGRLAVAIAVLGLGGCGVFDPTTEHRVIGIIRFDDETWPLPEVPGTATAGVPVEMTIWTMDTGCYSIGKTEVVVTGRIVEVTPFDYLTTGDHGCPAYLAFFEHKATVVVQEPGTAEIALVYSTGGDVAARGSQGGRAQGVHRGGVARGLGPPPARGPRTASVTFVPISTRYIGGPVTRRRVTRDPHTNGGRPSMTPVSDTVILQMVEAIVDVSDPEQVILFGSRGRGDFTERSDVDLIVVEALARDVRNRLGTAAADPGS